MSPLELSSPMTAGLEYCNITKTQGKELKMVFINMIEILKEKTNKSFKVIYEQQ